MKQLSMARQLRGGFFILPDPSPQKYDTRSFHANALASGAMMKPKNNRLSLFFAGEIVGTFVTSIVLRIT